MTITHDNVICIRSTQFKKFAQDNYEPEFLQAFTMAHERNVLRITLERLLKIVGAETLRKMVAEEIERLEHK